MVSVQSKNLFDVLAGSGDEGEVSGGPTAAAPAAKNATQAAKKAVQPQEGPGEGKKKENRPPRENRVRNEYPQRGGRAGNKAVTLRPKDQEGAGPEADARPAFRGPRAPRGEDTPQDHQRDKTDHRYGARGGYQGGRGRQYDRHSGGHRESERKASQGWGDPTENPEDAANPSGTAAVVPGDAADPWAAPASDPWAAPADPVDKFASGQANTPAEDPEAAARAAELRRLREEEEKQKTLDEYMAEKAGRAVALPEARKANEGADTTQWKDAVVLKHEEELVLFAGKDNAGKGKGRKERLNKAVLDIEQRFAPRPRPERTTDAAGGRGRGGFRGNEGGGRGRGGDQRTSRPTGDRNLNVGDEGAFPTLR